MILACAIISKTFYKTLLMHDYKHGFINSSKYCVIKIMISIAKIFNLDTVYGKMLLLKVPILQAYYKITTNLNRLRR